MEEIVKTYGSKYCEEVAIKPLCNRPYAYVYVMKYRDEILCTSDVQIIRDSQSGICLHRWVYIPMCMLSDS